MSEKYKIRDQEALYFITFAVIQWVDVFTRSEYKEIIVGSLKYCQKEKGLKIYSWCLMTNHIHMIVGSSGKNRIENIIRDFKKYSSVQVCEAIEMNKRESRKNWMLGIFREEAMASSKHQKYCFWQNSYHPIELNNKRIMDQKIDYIHDNPVVEEIVEQPEDYLYSSARDYRGKKGLLDIEIE